MLYVKQWYSAQTTSFWRQSINRLITVSSSVLEGLSIYLAVFSLFAFFVLRLDFFLDFLSSEVQNQMNQWMRKDQFHL